MWLVGADQVVGLVMAVMGSNSLAELCKSHIVDNRSYLIISYPPPRNSAMVLFLSSVAPGKEPAVSWSTIRLLPRA